MSKRTFTRTAVDCSAITASDLQDELANDPDATCYRLRIDDHAEAAEVVAFSIAPRIAIMWGGDSDWGDLRKAGDDEVLAAISDWLNDADAWEARN